MRRKRKRRFRERERVRYLLTCAQRERMRKVRTFSLSHDERRPKKKKKKMGVKRVVAEGLSRVDPFLCPLVAFFQKNIKHPTRKGNLSRVSYLSFVAVPQNSGVCVLRSFWRVFVSRASVGKKEERVFVFTKGDDIFIQRKDARAQKKKKKKERKNEREKESAFGGLFVRACVYIFIRGIRRRSSSSREREHFPALGEKRRRLVVHRFCERKRRKERKRSAKKKKTFWCR